MHFGILFVCFIITFLNDAESVGIPADTKALKFYYFSIDNPVKGKLIYLSNYTTIARTSWSPKKHTYFIIHGWNDVIGSGTVTSIRKALIKKHDINIFMVDWGRSAAEFYLLAVSKNWDLGNALATHIQSLVRVGGLDLKRTTLVGHSMGAHLAGVAGMALNGKLGAIVGLDPDGVGFCFGFLVTRLNPSSARFVQVIHTGGVAYGTMTELGHADYYPNRGNWQPMCGFFEFNCSHLKVLDYYVESLNGGNFLAKRCNYYSSYKNGDCNKNHNSKMGGFNIDKKARGVYYLQTNLNHPYAKHKRSLITLNNIQFVESANTSLLNKLSKLERRLGIAWV